MTEGSVIVVAYNPGETILTCLNALPKTIDGNLLEVIVVDNASHDGTPERVTAQFPQVRVLANTDNPGYGIGNNRGFTLSSGQFIIILNPDVVVRQNALKSMIEYLRHNPDVGIVGPRTFDSNNQPIITARHKYTVWRLLAKYLALNVLYPRIVYGTYGPLSLKSSNPIDVDWLHGSALVMQRELYTKLGGFDAGFFLFMEDVDICMRSKEAGWRVVYLPSAEVGHVGSESVSRYPVARIRSYHISPLYYFRKRGQHNAVRLLKAGFILSLILKSSVRRMQNLIKPDANRLEKARVEWGVIKDVWRY